MLEGIKLEGLDRIIFHWAMNFINNTEDRLKIIIGVIGLIAILNRGLLSQQVWHP
jgi:hypothetical protein